MTGLRLTAEQRRMIRRLSAEGPSLRPVARQVSCSHEGVCTIVPAASKWVWQHVPGGFSVGSPPNECAGDRAWV